MRQAVTTGGTAVALNVPYVDVAAKTGTAQLGVAKNKVNSWVIGFFPYENPKYAFTILMEAGPAVGTVGASVIMRQLFDWMYWETPEYFGLPKKEKQTISLPVKEEIVEGNQPSEQTSTTGTLLENEIVEVIPELEIVN
jgi:membrane peptidoglycan carboxypeptidase